VVRNALTIDAVQQTNCLPTTAMKRCRLKRSNLQIKIKMSKDNKTSDKQENGNDFIDEVVPQ